MTEQAKSSLLILEQGLDECEIPTLQEITDLLESNEIFISFSYNICCRKVHAIRLEKGTKPQAIFFNKKTEELYEKIVTIVKEKEYDNADIVTDLQDAYNNLVKPLKLKGKEGYRLIFSIDGNISGLPFNVIPYGNKGLLSDNFNITYISSGIIFKHLRQSRNQKKRYSISI